MCRNTISDYSARYIGKEKLLFYLLFWEYEEDKSTLVICFTRGKKHDDKYTVLRIGPILSVLERSHLVNQMITEFKLSNVFFPPFFPLVSQ